MFWRFVEIKWYILWKNNKVLDIISLIQLYYEYFLLLYSSTMCILEGNATLTLDLALTGLNAEYIKISGGTFKTMKRSYNIDSKFPKHRHFWIFFHAWFFFSYVMISCFFRLIVVAEKNVVYNKFPIPLINRLEKHFLNISTLLSPLQLRLTRLLDKWADEFITPSNCENEE